MSALPASTPTTTAYACSTCPVSGKRIRPGDEIALVSQGRWALRSELERQAQERIDAAQFRAQFAAFISRLGGASE